MRRKVAIIVASMMCVLCFGCSDNKTAASSSAAQSSATSQASSSAVQSSVASQTTSSASSQSIAASQSSSAENKKTGTLEEVKNPEVTVTEAKAEDTSKDYIKYEPADSIAHVIFSVKKEVKNFRIVKLAAKDVQDDGKIEFLYEEVFKTDTLTPEKPVLAGVDFGETIPIIGYMYTDQTGKDRLFPMGLSGLDGSILVWEYK